MDVDISERAAGKANTKADNLYHNKSTFIQLSEEKKIKLMKEKYPEP